MLIVILKELLFWVIATIVYTIWIISTDDDKPKRKESEEMRKKREQKECDQFNAENEGVNFLYRR